MGYRYTNARNAESDLETKDERKHIQKKKFGLILYLKNKYTENWLKNIIQTREAFTHIQKNMFYLKRLTFRELFLQQSMPPTSESRKTPSLGVRQYSETRLLKKICGGALEMLKITICIHKAEHMQSPWDMSSSELQVTEYLVCVRSFRIFRSRCVWCIWNEL